MHDQTLAIAWATTARLAYAVDSVAIQATEPAALPRCVQRHVPPDATWNHRNDDRLGGIHRGSDGIITFITEPMQLTGGRLRPVPKSVMADGEGRVSVLVQVSGR